jgi:hypothetical protein
MEGKLINALGLVWKLKYRSGLKGIEEEISSFPSQSLQSQRGFEVPKVALKDDSSRYEYNPRE